MGSRMSKSMVVKLDNSAGSITDITAYTNTITLPSDLDMQEDTPINAEERTYQPGLAGGVFEWSGWSNSTTDAMFAPLVINRTTITKTIKVHNGNKWFQGEAYPSSVELSGQPGQLQAWSCSLTVSGAITNTTS